MATWEELGISPPPEKPGPDASASEIEAYRRNMEAYKAAKALAERRQQREDE